MHIRNYLAALEFVNQERERRGLSPIERIEPGVPVNTNQCAIARSIPGVSVTNVLHDPERGTQALPREVLAFVASFDAGVLRRRAELDPADLVEGGIEDDKGCLVPA